jgi:hypothetical protein
VKSQQRQAYLGPTRQLTSQAAEDHMTRALPRRTGLLVTPLVAALGLAVGVLVLGPVAPAGAAVATVARPAAAVVAPAATVLPTLRYGSRGTYVRYVQPLVGVPATGFYGTRTVAAVKKFQTAHKLKATGVVAAATWIWLKRVAAYRAHVASRGTTTTGDPTMTSAARASRTARNAVSLAVWKTSPHGHMIVARESGGRCTAVSASGLYRGKWQMGSSFWSSFGGKAFASTPDRATCAEQDLVAYRGWLASWWGPWGG